MNTVTDVAEWIERDLNLDMDGWWIFDPEEGLETLTARFPTASSEYLIGVDEKELSLEIRREKDQATTGRIVSGEVWEELVSGPIALNTWVEVLVGIASNEIAQGIQD